MAALPCTRYDSGIVSVATPDTYHLDIAFSSCDNSLLGHCLFKAHLCTGLSTRAFAGCGGAPEVRQIQVLLEAPPRRLRTVSSLESGQARCRCKS